MCYTQNNERFEKDLEKWIVDFCAVLSTKNASKNTLDAYRRDCIQLKTYLITEVKVTRIAEVTKTTMESYFALLENESNQAATVRRKLSVIKQFFEYLIQGGQILQNPLDSLRLSNKNSYIESKTLILQEDDIKKLLSSCRGIEVKQIRNRAILGILCETGLKPTELVKLQLNAVNDDCTTLMFNSNNFGLSTVTASSLQNYIKATHGTLVESSDYREAQYIFVNDENKPFTRQWLWKVIKKQSIKAQLSTEITPKTLRDTYVYNLLKLGLSKKEIIQITGVSHQNISKLQ